MEHHHAVDDQSHYEISLTAGQAFVAFVLLLLSLAAAFAFGLMLGRGHADERLVVQKEPEVVTEASLAPRKADGRIIELGVPEDDFAEPAAKSIDRGSREPQIAELPAAQTEVVAVAEAPAPTEAPVEAQPATVAAAGERGSSAAQIPSPDAPPVPHYAQLLSTSDQKTAEALAARLIDAGFLSSYVERGQSDKGPVFRVRVRFPSEQQARAAEPKLREFSKEVWITRR